MGRTRVNPLAARLSGRFRNRSRLLPNARADLRALRVSVFIVLSARVDTIAADGHRWPIRVHEPGAGMRE